MKDAMGHGSNNRGGRLAKPIPGHRYHQMPDENLRYIMKDAHEAGRNAQDMGDQKGINKYADQVNDAATVLAYRRAGGKQDQAAAAQLHSGTSKSNVVPVHDSMAGGYAHVGAAYDASKSSLYGPGVREKALASGANRPWHMK